MISVHRDVPTVLHLPDDIERAWSTDRGELLLQGVKSDLYIRPRLDAPVGLEAYIEVETRTLHWIFLVRVVERVEDAMQEVVVPATAAAEAAGDAARDAPPEAEAEAEAAEPATAATDTRPSAGGPEPEPPAPPPIEPVIASTGEAVTERAAATDDASRFDLFVHTVAALPGFTSLELDEHAPGTTLRSHSGLGLRVVAAPKDTWWAVETNISAEWLDGPLTYESSTVGRTPREVTLSGPWLRAEIGLRARYGTRWIPTVYAGLGAQVHLRRVTAVDSSGSPQVVTTMKDGAVLALGMGLHYRASDLMLGLDFQARRGAPDDYRSIAVLWNVGYRLDQGEEP